MNRRTFLSSLALVAVPGLALAGSGRVFAPGGVALDGVDPVGFFTEGRVVQGLGEFALMWKGATWLFSSEANRAAFEADPYRYAPAFGGYCAYAMSRGYTASGDPDAFAIEDGKLYLTHSQVMRELWSKEKQANIALAHQNWPEILN